MSPGWHERAPRTPNGGVACLATQHLPRVCPSSPLEMGNSLWRNPRAPWAFLTAPRREGTEVAGVGVFFKHAPQRLWNPPPLAPRPPALPPR